MLIEEKKAEIKNILDGAHLPYLHHIGEYGEEFLIDDSSVIFAITIDKKMDWLRSVPKRKNKR